MKINEEILRKIVDMKTAPSMYCAYFYYPFSIQSKYKKYDGTDIEPVSQKKCCPVSTEKCLRVRPILLLLLYCYSFPFKATNGSEFSYISI